MRTRESAFANGPLDVMRRSRRESPYTYKYKRLRSQRVSHKQTMHVVQYVTRKQRCCCLIIDTYLHRLDAGTGHMRSECTILVGEIASLVQCGDAHDPSPRIACFFRKMAVRRTGKS